ncbi:MAG TPA: DUF4085 family protein [Phycisphaerae bacterium]
MKHYTLDWWISCQSPGPREDAAARCQEYVESIRNHLPTSVIALWETNLHDGELRHLQVMPIKREVLFVFDVPWERGRTVRRRLTFTGVSELRFTSDPERALAGPHGFGDFGYWEVDLCDGGYEYRGIFSSGIEMFIRFTNVETEED